MARPFRGGCAGVDRRVLAVWVLGVGLVAAGTAAYLAFPASGTLVVQVRDAVGSFSHLYVTFSQVQVHPAGAANDSGWERVNLSASMIDFAALGNLTKLLGMDRLPAGRYTQIRIIVSGASGTLVGGASVSLVVPDGIVKTTTPFELARGGTTTVTLDFDLARSVVLNGGSWTFKPVLGPVVVS